MPSRNSTNNFRFFFEKNQHNLFITYNDLIVLELKEIAIEKQIELTPYL